jgi:hypothetical protein
MVELPKEFQDKVDKHSDFIKFRQIKKKDCFYIYERSKNGAVNGYEAIKANIVKAGTKHPFSKKFVEEDYESYPTARQFGKDAYFCTTLKRAEQKFSQLIEAEKRNKEKREERKKKVDKNVDGLDLI